MYLADYLRASGNQVAREQLLSHRLIYDLKLETARAGHSLLCTAPEVDRDGWDFVLWLETETRFIQCKAYTGRPQSGWEIHKRVITPTADEASDILHRDRWYVHLGFGGALIVISAQPSGDGLKVGYHYADLMTIWALSQGLICKKRDVSLLAARFLDELQGEPVKIKLPRGLLLNSRSNAHLVAMLGMQSVVPPMFRSNLRRLLVDSRGGNVLDTSGNPIVTASIAQLNDCFTDLV